MLSEVEVVEKLKSLEGWQLKEKFIFRRFDVLNFAEAAKFVEEIARIGSRFQHYPDVAITQRLVTVETTTRVKGELTELDFRLAEAINRFYDTFKQRQEKREIKRVY